jgi:hypothetical protein
VTGGRLTADGPIILDGASARFRAGAGTSAVLGGLDITGTATSAVVDVAATSFSVNRPSVVTGKSSVDFVVRPDQFGVFDGGLRVTGGSGADRVEMSSQMAVLGDLVARLGAGDDVVALAGTADRSTAVHLVVATGSGADRVTLDGLQVAGRTTIQTGTGADMLSVPAGKYMSPFEADLGADDDAIRIGDVPGGKVRFNRRVTIRAGDGNDTLALGLSPAAGGEPQVFVELFGEGNRITGGAGVNLFDDEAGQFADVDFGTGIVSWVDPTP